MIINSPNYSKTKMQRAPASTSSRDSVKTEKKNVETNTESSISFCKCCLGRKNEEQSNLDVCEPVDKQTLLHYKKAIDYINSCHSIINEYLTKMNNQECLRCHNKSASINICMPDLPNFMAVLSSLTTINKEGLCINCSKNDWICKSTCEYPRKQNQKRSRYTRPKSLGRHPENLTKTLEKVNSIPDSRKSSAVQFAPSSKSAEDVADVRQSYQHNQCYHKVGPRALQSVSATEDSEYDPMSPKKTNIPKPESLENRADGPNVKVINAVPKNCSQGNVEDRGDTGSFISTKSSSLHPGSQKLNHAHADAQQTNFKALYSMLEQQMQILQNNQIMPLYQIMDFLKTQTFFTNPNDFQKLPQIFGQLNTNEKERSTTEHSQSDGSEYNSINEVNFRTVRSTGNCRNKNNENLHTKGAAMPHSVKNSAHLFAPNLVSPEDIKNYTTEMMKNNPINSSPELTPRQNTSENFRSTQHSLVTEDISRSIEDTSPSNDTSDKRGVSQTKIPTVVKNQKRKCSQAHKSEAKSKHSSHSTIENKASKEMRNLQSISSNEVFEMQSAFGEFEGNINQGFRESLQPNTNQAIIYAMQQLAAANAVMFQQRMKPYIVQQKKSDHFVCNRQKRKEKIKNAYTIPGGDTACCVEEKNASNCNDQKNPNEDVTLRLYYDEDRMKMQEAESVQLNGTRAQQIYRKPKTETDDSSNRSVKSKDGRQTDSSEIETDKEDIIRQFTPRKIIIDSNGTTTKMKCGQKDEKTGQKSLSS